MKLLAALTLSVVALGTLGCGEKSKEPEPKLEPPDPNFFISQTKEIRIFTLKEIHLAFANFHDVFDAFPPSGLPVNDDDPPNGKLSWRVWVLPLLDHPAFYEKFRTREDWDSEHNRQFITEMPDILNARIPRADGKCSYHVFVGNGAPFSDERKTSIGDYADRLDRTILVIEAGPDKAVEWTKPGGLEFDPKNPKAALGNVPDVFYAVMMDGSVRELTKDITNEELLELITGGKTPEAKD